MKVFVFFVFLLSAFLLSAQENEKIRFAKDKRFIYFFQVSKATDTITKGKSDQFIYLVPDSIRRFIVLKSENAQMSPTKNDSILICRYLPGIRYETFFVEKTDRLYLQSGINGTSVVPKEKIHIQIIDTRINKVLIENSYYPSGE